MKKNYLIVFVFFLVFILGYFFDLLVCFVLNVVSKESLSASVTAFSTALLSLFALITMLYNRNFYEIKRREKAIDLLKDWNYNLDAKNSLSRKFAEELNEEELKKILKEKDFTIKDKDNIEILKNIFEEYNGEETVNNKISALLRWELIKYLNKLENICSAWYYHVVDKELIESEFRYLFQNGNAALKKVREIEEDSFPCIDLFEKTMKDRFKLKIEEKNKL